MLNTWWSACLDLLFPPKCPVCRQPVDGHGAWCPRCLAAVQGARALNLAEHRLEWLDECYAACEYTAGVKRLIHDMKFRRKDNYAVHLRWLVEQACWQSGKLFTNVDAVIPVPLHADRLAQRGFNQSERIFKPWAEKLGLSWLDILMRQHPTVPQWELSLAERRKNIKGAFMLTRPECVRDKHILLVDDIFTSGITMDECSRVLKISGARRITGLVVASGAN